MADALPEIEGKYEILEKLQVGGMGSIYKVRHRLLGDERVIKMLRPQLLGDPSFQKRFHREARAATRLTHPNIARLYDYSIDETGAAYIVMEYIEGWPLEHLVTRGERAPLGLVLEIARQSLRAIAHLHARGVIHRDISPDNLMLTRDVDGRAAIKLIDLGLAKSVTASEELITATGMFVGKFRYAAPEHFQRDDGALVGPASDLYSFGLVLYELLTGRYPIQGDSAQSLIAGHLYHPPLDFDVSDPERRVPDDLRGVVLRTLAKKPADRFAGAEELSAALEPIRQRFEVDTRRTRRLLARLDEPPRSALHAPPSHSTQSRLDRQFTGPTPTEGVDTAAPPPEPAADADRAASRPSTPGLAERIEIQVADGDYAAARDELRRAREADGDSAELRELARRIDEIERIARTRRVEKGMDGVEALRAAGKVAEALEKARGLRELAPEHKLVQMVIHELEKALDDRVRPSAGDVDSREVDAGDSDAADADTGDADTGDADTSDADTDVFVFETREIETRGGEDEIDDAALATTTPFQVAYPAPTEAFDAAALAQTEILPQVRQEAAAAVDEDVRTQLLDSFADAAGAPEPARIESREFDEISLQSIPQYREPAADAPDLPMTRQRTPEPAREPEAAPAELRLGPDAGSDGVDDLTLAINEGGDVATAKGPPLDEPLASRRSTGRLVAVASILAVVFLLIGIALSRLVPSKDSGDVLDEEEIAAARLSTGTLVVEATPVAEIVRIVDAEGRERTLPEEATTPVVLELDAGAYRLTLRDPSTGAQAEVEATVVVGEEKRVSRIIGP